LQRTSIYTTKGKGLASKSPVISSLLLPKNHHESQLPGEGSTLRGILGKSGDAKSFSSKVLVLQSDKYMPNDLSPQTRASLLARLVDSADREAWTEFVDVYGGLVYREVCRRGVAHPDSEDVTQTVFVRLLSALPKFRYQPVRGRFRDWLGTLIRFEVSRFRRSGSRRVEESVDTEILESTAEGVVDPEWSEAFQTTVLSAAMQRARGRFDKPTWDAFVEVWVKNRSAAEIATEFDRTVDWVYVAKSRVLKCLAEQIHLLLDEFPFVEPSEAGDSAG
jgi:RNA polymerase sigma-70 factor (ECF subfamily)